MNDTQEAMARLAIAGIEARRLKEKAEKRSHRWRFAFLTLRIAGCFALAAYLQVSQRQISGRQVIAFVLIYIAGTAWENYRAGEALRSLQSELARLQDEIEKKSA